MKKGREEERKWGREKASGRWSGVSTGHSLRKKRSFAAEKTECDSIIDSINFRSVKEQLPKINTKLYQLCASRYVITERFFQRWLTEYVRIKISSKFHMKLFSWKTIKKHQKAERNQNFFAPNGRVKPKHAFPHLIIYIVYSVRNDRNKLVH